MGKPTNEPVRDLIAYLLGEGIPKNVCDPSLDFVVHHKTYHFPGGCSKGTNNLVSVRSTLSVVPRRRLCLECVPGWVSKDPWIREYHSQTHSQVKVLTDVFFELERLHRILKYAPKESFPDDWDEAAMLLTRWVRFLKNAPEQGEDFSEVVQERLDEVLSASQESLQGEVARFLEVHAESLKTLPEECETGSLGPAIVGLESWASAANTFVPRRARIPHWGRSLWIVVAHAIGDPLESEHVLARLPASVSDMVVTALGTQDGADLAFDVSLSDAQLEVASVLWPGRMLQDALEGSRLIVRDSEPLA